MKTFWDVVNIFMVLFGMTPIVYIAYMVPQIGITILVCAVLVGIMVSIDRLRERITNGTFFRNE